MSHGTSIRIRPRPLSYDERLPIVRLTDLKEGDAGIDFTILQWLRHQVDQQECRNAETQSIPVVKEHTTSHAPAAIISTPGVRLVPDYDKQLEVLQRPKADNSLPEDLGLTPYLRYPSSQQSQLVEDVLCRYDMDDEDEAWLLAYNEKARLSSRRAVVLSADAFEAMIRAMEVALHEAVLKLDTWQPEVAAGKLPVLPMVETVLPCQAAQHALASHGPPGVVSAVWERWKERRKQNAGMPLLPHLCLEMPWKAISFLKCGMEKDDMPFVEPLRRSPLPRGNAAARLGNEAVLAALDRVRMELEALRTLTDIVRRRERMKLGIVRRQSELANALMARQQGIREAAGKASRASASPVPRSPTAAGKKGLKQSSGADHSDGENLPHGGVEAGRSHVLAGTKFAERNQQKASHDDHSPAKAKKSHVSSPPREAHRVTGVVNSSKVTEDANHLILKALSSMKKRKRVSSVDGASPATQSAPLPNNQSPRLVNLIQAVKEQRLATGKKPLLARIEGGMQGQVAGRQKGIKEASVPHAVARPIGRPRKEPAGLMATSSQVPMHKANVTTEGACGSPKLASAGDLGVRERRSSIDSDTYILQPVKVKSNSRTEPQSPRLVSSTTDAAKGGSKVLHPPPDKQTALPNKIKPVHNKAIDGAKDHTLVSRHTAAREMNTASTSPRPVSLVSNVSRVLLHAATQQGSGLKSDGSRPLPRGRPPVTKKKGLFLQVGKKPLTTSNLKLNGTLADAGGKKLALNHKAADKSLGTVLVADACVSTRDMFTYHLPEVVSVDRIKTPERLSKAASKKRVSFNPKLIAPSPSSLHEPVLPGTLANVTKSEVKAKMMGKQVHEGEPVASPSEIHDEDAASRKKGKGRLVHEGKDVASPSKSFVENVTSKKRGRGKLVQESEHVASLSDPHDGDMPAKKRGRGKQVHEGDKNLASPEACYKDTSLSKKESRETVHADESLPSPSEAHNDVSMDIDKPTFGQRSEGGAESAASPSTAHDSMPKCIDKPTLELSSGGGVASSSKANEAVPNCFGKPTFGLSRNAGIASRSGAHNTLPTGIAEPTLGLRRRGRSGHGTESTEGHSNVVLPDKQGRDSSCTLHDLSPRGPLGAQVNGDMEKQQPVDVPEKLARGPKGTTALKMSVNNSFIRKQAAKVGALETEEIQLHSSHPEEGGSHLESTAAEDNVPSTSGNQDMPLPKFGRGRKLKAFKNANRSHPSNTDPLLLSKLPNLQLTGPTPHSVIGSDDCVIVPSNRNMEEDEPRPNVNLATQALETEFPKELSIRSDPPRPWGSHSQLPKPLTVFQTLADIPMPADQQDGRSYSANTATKSRTRLSKGGSAADAQELTSAALTEPFFLALPGKFSDAAGLQNVSKTFLRKAKPVQAPSGGASAGSLAAVIPMTNHVLGRQVLPSQLPSGADADELTVRNVQTQAGPGSINAPVVHTIEYAVADEKVADQDKAKDVVDHQVGDAAQKPKRRRVASSEEEAMGSAPHSMSDIMEAQPGQSGTDNSRQLVHHASKSSIPSKYAKAEAGHQQQAISSRGVSAFASAPLEPSRSLAVLKSTDPTTTLQAKRSEQVQGSTASGPAPNDLSGHSPKVGLASVDVRKGWSPGSCVKRKRELQNLQLGGKFGTLQSAYSDDMLTRSLRGRIACP